MPRMLETEPLATKSNGNYLVMVWLSVVMFFVLWFVLSSLFNMEIAEDTLLYAKFLTVDAK